MGLAQVQGCEPTRQLVECSTVNLRCYAEWFWVVMYRWQDRRKRYTTRVDILLGGLLRAQDGRRSKDLRVLYQQTNKQTNKPPVSVVWSTLVQVSTVPTNLNNFLFQSHPVPPILEIPLSLFPVFWRSPCPSHSGREQRLLKKNIFGSALGVALSNALRSRPRTVWSELAVMDK